MLSEIIQSAALLVPIGINPLLTVAFLGIASSAGVYTAPAGLAPFMQPAAWLSLLAIGLVVQLGRSSKLTKPFAEAIGGLESLFALALVGVMIAPQLEASASSVLPSLAMLLLGLISMLVIVVFRTSIDLVTWLSPLPGVDFLLQLGKGLLTAGLIALAILAPSFALAVNVLSVLIAALMLRWAVRTARYGLSILHDLTLGRFQSELAMPRDKVIPEDLGPFTAFVVQAGGFPRRSKGQVRLEVGRWYLTVPRLVGAPRVLPLGDAAKGVFSPGFFGTTLHLPNGALLLPPRYRHLIEPLRKETAARITAAPRGPISRRARAARASTI